MCTYEDLVAATLPYGLSPLVVPQLKTITLGGAITGLGIESASFRNGLPHESVLEMDILTGTGELLTVSSQQHPDLYRAFPNSYGTLGYSTRIRIELESVKPFVALRHVRFNSLTELLAAIDRIIETSGLDGVPVDYLDGVVFGAEESYLCVGVRTTTPGPVSDYTGQDIYYRSIQHDAGIKEDRLTMHDYFWRWDTDWFWCSRSFGAQNPRVRRWWPRRYRRSDTYWKLVALDQRFGIADRIEKRNGRPPRERVVQAIKKETAIRQAGQRIVIQVVLELLFGPLAVGDVAVDDDQLGDGARGITDGAGKRLQHSPAAVFVLDAIFQTLADTGFARFSGSFQDFETVVDMNLLKG